MNVPWSPSRSYSPTKSLEDVLEQYVFFFTSNLGFPITDSNILLTEQDIADIVAFLRLL
jgi:hypothetical protein